MKYSTAAAAAAGACKARVVFACMASSPACLRFCSRARATRSAAMLATFVRLAINPNTVCVCWNRRGREGERQGRDGERKEEGRGTDRRIDAEARVHKSVGQIQSGHTMCPHCVALCVMASHCHLHPQLEEEEEGRRRRRRRWWWGDRRFWAMRPFVRAA